VKLQEENKMAGMDVRKISRSGIQTFFLSNCMDSKLKKKKKQTNKKKRKQQKNRKKIPTILSFSHTPLWMDGLVVRALAFHHCDPGTISRSSLGYM